MNQQAAFYKLVDKYKDNNQVEFIYVYISEAHPSDGWHLKNKRSIKQHTKINQKINSLKLLIEDIEEKISENIDNNISLLNCQNVKFIVDNMDTSSNLECIFMASPDRLAIIKNNYVLFQGNYGPMFYKVGAIERYLDNLFYR